MVIQIHGENTSNIQNIRVSRKKKKIIMIKKRDRKIWKGNVHGCDCHGNDYELL
jgi:hypothetical protein